jgi:hypothetical protein
LNLNKTSAIASDPSVAKGQGEHEKPRGGIKMYVLSEEMHNIANGLVYYFEKGNMICFAKFSADLYEIYDEFTANEIMSLLRTKILQLK